jgi:hypothetical protein
LNSRVTQEIEDAVTLAIEQPAFDQVRVANEVRRLKPRNHDRKS